MCTGAIRGFAGLKFSTSPRRLGAKDVIIIITNRILIRGVISLIRNKGLNFTLSLLNSVVEGLVEPFSCNKIK